MLSDNDNIKRIKRSPRRRRTPYQLGARYSDAQKIEACQLYMLTGNLSAVSMALQINYETLKVWKKSQWWKDLERELRLQDELQLSVQLKKIVAKSLSNVEDRLENGDFTFDKKTGKLIRRPVTALTAHKIAVDMMDKRDSILDKALGETTIAEDKIQKTLENLAESFKKMAQQSKGTVEVTDVITVEKENTDAVLEEREEGLQDGVSEVPQPSGATGEPLEEDDGSEGSQ